MILRRGRESPAMSRHYCAASALRSCTQAVRGQVHVQLLPHSNLRGLSPLQQAERILGNVHALFDAGHDFLVNAGRLRGRASQFRPKLLAFRAFSPGESVPLHTKTILALGECLNLRAEDGMKARQVCKNTAAAAWLPGS